MRLKIHSAIASTVIALATGLGQANGQKPHTSQVQETFSAEDEGVKKPAPIPAEVLAILSRDEMVRGELENENIKPERIPASWFSASQIPLGEKNTNDLIVEAARPLVGANVNMFWILIRTDWGFKLVLTLPSHDLAVLNRRSRGYRDIEASAENCCSITTAKFRFNGKEYERYSSKTENIK